MVNLSITYTLSRTPCLGLVFLQQSLSLFLLKLVWTQSKNMQRSHAHGFAILHSGAMHILGFWVRVVRHPTSSAILTSGVQWALNLRSAWRTKSCASIFQKLSKSEAMAARAHSDSPSTHPRDSIAIPASLMRGDTEQMLAHEPMQRPC